MKSIRTWFAERFRPRTLGERGEQAATRHLRRKGFKIIERRLRLRVGEIDIIAVDGETVVFVEVKTRRSVDLGRPSESISKTQQARLTRAALAFLKSHGLLENAARFDVVEVIWPEAARRPEIRHFPNAFPAVGHRQFFS